jgi:hypothetical protein
MAVDGRGINLYLYGCTAYEFPIIALSHCHRAEPITEEPGVKLPFGCEAFVQA